MIKNIFDKFALTNEDLKEVVAAYSVPFMFRVVPVSGDDNQWKRVESKRYDN